MTDWMIFARDEYVADSRDFDVFWDDSALLLEGAPSDPSGDLESLDEIFDARFSHLDETASRMAEAAGRACTNLHADALALRYELVRLLRLAAFFSVVRPLGRDPILSFFYDPRRDADYAALLQSIADATDGTLRLAPVRAESDAQSVLPPDLRSSLARRAPFWRLDPAQSRSQPKSSARRATSPDVAPWRSWAATANAAFDACLNAIRRDARAPIALLGRPEILDPVCGELLARGERVVWLWEHFHAGVFARWRAAGVQLVTLDGAAGRSAHLAPSQRRSRGRAVARENAEPASLGDLSGAGLMFPGPHGRPIDLVPAIRAWAATRRESFARRARLAAQCERLFAAGAPRALVLDEDATLLKRTAISAAQRVDAPSFVVQHGAPGVRFGFSPVAADCVLAWGEASRERLLDWGVASLAIDVVGCPRRDGWSDIARSDPSRTRVRASHDSCSTVLVLASPAPRDERPDSLAFPLTTAAHREMWSNVFHALASRSNVRAIVKLHPRDADRAALERLAQNCGAVVEWRSEGDAADYFAEADAVVSLASSAGLEAAAWGLPVVSVVPSRAAPLYSARDWG
ncbi:MAG TPA: hypothetical protein VGE52_04660, partial [Pirellulales bacterium]